MLKVAAECGVGSGTVQRIARESSKRPPGAVLEHVLDALRQAEAWAINSSERTDNQTVLFAPTKILNDINDRFYNRMAKSLDFQF